MGYRRFRNIGVDNVKMDFAFFAIAFNIKKMVAKMTKGGLFSYLRAYIIAKTKCAFFQNEMCIFCIFFAVSQLVLNGLLNGF